MIEAANLKSQCSQKKWIKLWNFLFFFLNFRSSFHFYYLKKCVTNFVKILQILSASDFESRDKNLQTCLSFQFKVELR